MLRPAEATARRDDRRGAMGVPRWWAVLAVLLGLMALVVSVSSVTHQAVGSTTPARGRVDGAVRKGAYGKPASTTTTSEPASSRAVDPPVAPTTTDPSEPSSSGTTVVTNPADEPAATSGVSQVSTGGPTVGPTATAPPTAPTTEAGGTNAGTTTSTTAAAQSYPGNLEYPDNVSATYQVATSGATAATATWSGTPELVLSISCPGGQAQQSGTTGLSVSVPARTSAGGDETCSITLSEPSSVEATVSYSLSVEPAGS